MPSDFLPNAAAYTKKNDFEKCRGVKVNEIQNYFCVKAEFTRTAR